MTPKKSRKIGNPPTQKKMDRKDIIKMLRDIKENAVNAIKTFQLLKRVKGLKLASTDTKAVEKLRDGVVKLADAAQERQFFSPDNLRTILSAAARTDFLLNRTFVNYTKSWESRYDRMMAEIRRMDPELLIQHMDELASHKKLLGEIFEEGAPPPSRETILDAYNNVFGHLMGLKAQAEITARKAVAAHEEEEISALGDELADIGEDFDKALAAA